MARSVAGAKAKEAAGWIPTDGDMMVGGEALEAAPRRLPFEELRDGGSEALEHGRPMLGQGPEAGVYRALLRRPLGSCRRPSVSAADLLPTLAAMVGRAFFDRHLLHRTPYLRWSGCLCCSMRKGPAATALSRHNDN